jgi:hypothetical protein
MDRLSHRDRLLSLKYSTIEACFSVPMLNLTLPLFPFVLAFAVTGLGWQAGAVGVMAALPHICNFQQPLLLAVLSKRFSNYGLLVLIFPAPASLCRNGGFALEFGRIICVPHQTESLQG